MEFLVTFHELAELIEPPEESQVAVTSFFWSGTFHEFPKLAAYWDRLPPIVVKSSEARTKKNADSLCDCQGNPNRELEGGQEVKLLHVGLPSALLL